MPFPIDLEPSPVPPSRPAVVALVYRYDPEADPDERYELMPGLRVIEVYEQRGPHPAAARFRYAFDEVATVLNPDLPTRAEQVWGLDADGVHIDERLVVRVYDPTSEEPDAFVIAFDGHAGYPQLDVSGDRESVTFQAYGRPVRLWDDVILDVTQRHADDPAAASTTVVPLRARFNPEGLPNCTADDTEENLDEDNEHPAFLDVLVATPLQKKTPKEAAFWTVSNAVRYLLYVHNADEEFVKNPKSDEVKQLFDSWVAVSGDEGDIDPKDPATFTAKPIEVQDLDVTGDTLPVALQKVIEPHGFAFRFAVSQGEPEDDGFGGTVPGTGGDPEWRFEFYRTDTEDPLLSLRLAPPLEDLDLTRTNTESVSLARDGEVMNSWVGLTAQTVVEAAFVLAPMFAIDPTDADNANLKKWVEDNPSYDPTKYREWGVDETGDGHWDFTTEELLEEAPDLSEALGDTVADGVNVYAVRRRPGRNKLVSLDATVPDKKTEHKKSALYISADYAGTAPGVWDGTGTWQEIDPGHGWELTEQRLGIRLTCKDPENWTVGDPFVGSVSKIGTGPRPYPAGLVRAVKGQAVPAGFDAGQFFTLMLVTVVETDLTLGSDPHAKAGRRAASPVSFQVLRADELRDRFIIEARHKSSPFAPAGAPRFENVRDDSKKLLDHLRARRRAHELAVVAGEAVIPQIDYSYRIGDRISGAVGRDLDFRMNVVTGAEAPVYPVIEGITWTYEDRQMTRCSLSDRRSDPPPEKRT